MLRIGMKVRVKAIVFEGLPEINAYIGKTGVISGDGDGWMGQRGYYVKFDDGSLSKKFYENELAVTKVHISNQPNIKSLIATE